MRLVGQNLNKNVYLHLSLDNMGTFLVKRAILGSGLIKTPPVGVGNAALDNLDHFAKPHVNLVEEFCKRVLLSNLLCLKYITILGCHFCTIRLVYKK